MAFLLPKTSRFKTSLIFYGPIGLARGVAARSFATSVSLPSQAPGSDGRRQGTVALSRAVARPLNAHDSQYNAQVYAPDVEHMWLPGVVCQASADGKKLTVRLENIAGPADPKAAAGIPSEKALRELMGSQVTVDLNDPQMVKFVTARSADSGSQISLPLQNEKDSSANSTGYEDMITIDHLHEASILHNLRRRFFNKLPCECLPGGCAWAVYACSQTLIYLM